MNNTKLFDYFILDKFCKIYEVDKTKIIEEPIYNFRYMCFKFNYFMQHISLPKIKKDNLYESVIVEFREFPHIEFIIRNTILKTTVFQ